MRMDTLIYCGHGDLDFTMNKPRIKQVKKPMSEVQPASLNDDITLKIVGCIASTFLDHANIALNLTDDEVAAKRLLRGTDTVFRTLLACSCTCKSLLDFLGAANPVWMQLFDVFHKMGLHDYHLRETSEALACIKRGSLTAKRALILTSMTGCELCMQARIRKVYWEFGLRCCRGCLEANTISDYRLQHDCNLPESSFEHLPHTIVQMYAPKIGTYTLRFYWSSSPQLVALLRQQHSMTDAVADANVCQAVQLAKQAADAAAAQAARLAAHMRLSAYRVKADVLYEAVVRAASSEDMLWAASSLPADSAELERISRRFGYAAKVVKHHDKWAADNIAELLRDAMTKAAYDAIDRWIRDEPMGHLLKNHGLHRLGVIVIDSVSAAHDLTALQMEVDTVMTEELRKLTEKQVHEPMTSIQKKRDGMPCPMCNQSRRFSSPSSLAQHIQDKHITLEPKP